MHFGDSGRQCVSVDTDRQIQLVARVRGPDENVLWGVLADDVAAISVRRADGSVFARDVRRAFGVLEAPGEKVVSIAALDDEGRQLGKVSASGLIPVSCALTSCVTVDVSFDDDRVLEGLRGHRFACEPCSRRETAWVPRAQRSQPCQRSTSIQALTRCASRRRNGLPV